MRKPIIVGNWKMNKTPSEAEAFMKEMETYLTGDEASDYGIGAPFIDLDACVRNTKHLIIAAENCHFEDNGAYTGEVSVPMLKEVGVTYCIIGHSERRGMFNETDETVNKKLHKLFANGITPIMCCGESLETYEAGKTEEWVRGQVKNGLAGLTSDQVSSMVIAYEPIWAIGTGKSATKEIAENTCAIVRDEVKKNFGEEASSKVRIQYGGSVKPENIKEYMAEEDIDGALIGGASLKPESFKAIIDATK